jgi:hypothetical protein
MTYTVEYVGGKVRLLNKDGTLLFTHDSYVPLALAMACGEHFNDPAACFDETTGSILTLSKDPTRDEEFVWRLHHIHLNLVCELFRVKPKVQRTLFAFAKSGNHIAFAHHDGSISVFNVATIVVSTPYLSAECVFSAHGESVVGISKLLWNRRYNLVTLDSYGLGMVGITEWNVDPNYLPALSEPLLLRGTVDVTDMILSPCGEYLALLCEHKDGATVTGSVSIISGMRYICPMQVSFSESASSYTHGAWSKDGCFAAINKLEARVFDMSHLGSVDHVRHNAGKTYYECDIVHTLGRVNKNVTKHDWVEWRGRRLYVNGVRRVIHRVRNPDSEAKRAKLADSSAAAGV